jgi:pre-mRNA 3'-end-processing factor FIP1
VYSSVLSFFRTFPQWYYLKNFAGMPEEQIASLPPEVRAMVMTTATSLMSGGAMSHGGPPLMGVGVGGPNPMMDMGMMGVMNGGDVQAMQAAGMMPVGVGDGEVMGMQGMDGFQPGGPGPGPGQMMGMGQEFGMQASVC